MFLLMLYVEKKGKNYENTKKNDWNFLYAEKERDFLSRASHPGSPTALSQLEVIVWELDRHVLDAI